MKQLTKEQVFNLRLNIYTNIWTTGFLELDLDESYLTPFGKLECKPGSGWHFSGIFPIKSNPDTHITYNRTKLPLAEFLLQNKINFAVDCPIIKKLRKNRTSGLVFKILGYPNDVKCWI